VTQTEIDSRGNVYAGGWTTFLMVNLAWSRRDSGLIHHAPIVPHNMADEEICPGNCRWDPE
jgi:hypothetical protein